MRQDEYDKVYSVHSFKAKPGSKKRQAWEGIKKKDGAKFYMLKYASKYEQKTVPDNFLDVGRFWGVSRDVENRDFHEIEVTEQEIRDYLSSKAIPVTKAEILPKLIIITK